MSLAYLSVASVFTGSS